jgi:hypothetical protein
MLSWIEGVHLQIFFYHHCKRVDLTYEDTNRDSKSQTGHEPWVRITYGHIGNKGILKNKQGYTAHMCYHINCHLEPVGSECRVGVGRSYGTAIQIQWPLAIFFPTSWVSVRCNGSNGKFHEMFGIVQGLSPNQNQYIHVLMYLNSFF